jgi:hypothetical protein
VGRSGVIIIDVLKMLDDPDEIILFSSIGYNVKYHFLAFEYKQNGKFEMGAKKKREGDVPKKKKRIKGLN